MGPIEELVRLLTKVAPQAHTAVSGDRFNRDWTPQTHSRGGVGTAPEISYGHNIERVWLVMSACRAIGLPLDLYDEHFAAVYEDRLKNGFDRERGGF